MSRLNSRLALVLALGVIVGCKQSRSSAASGADSANASSADASDSEDAAPLDCVKVYSPADVAAILKAPAKVGAYTPRPGSCTFETANGGGSVMVVTGTDFTSEMTWRDVTSSAHRSKYVSLPGVGDEAYRSVSDGSEVYARKGKMYCSVLLDGISTGVAADFTSERGEALSKKMGAICSKAFAAG